MTQSIHSHSSLNSTTSTGGGKTSGRIIDGVGLGYRREMITKHDEILSSRVDFIEVAPENWIPMNTPYQRPLREISEQIPLSTHGLSLSLGSPDPLDVDFVKQVKVFLEQFNVAHYTEHLSYCSAGGHMYDLMPIPFTSESVKYVANRIKQVQDILERQIAVENVSYYLQQNSELSEIEFTKAVLEEADCSLLLDVNNVYVNSINHGYDSREFINAMPTERVVYGHIAGHYDEADDLKVDTHGSPVKDSVWDLLDYAYQKHGAFPTLLERDFNIPSMAELNIELEKISKIQALHQKALAC